MSSRVGLRFFQNARAAFRNASAPFRRPGAQGRRFQSTEAPAAEQQSTFQRLWNSPVGVKTWGLVIAGISDFSRPAEKLSLTQNCALMATGAIWTRWCMIITPRNYLLAAVNFFLGCVGVVQVGRIVNYRRSVEGSTKEALKDVEHEVVDSAKATVAKVEAVVEKK
ncbi:hypothetical protein ATEG_07153 [Aspergillus terreus NIH2624]|uniref:Mitochondrial pyruvate carrier n=1 Tax=Aspergillus terreus (strain NIH 2624 / FGSC A1156) TaxID=341663 RepID=Q0CGN9_ASPTN|nr:uncharacterized protein ATEG_07153 [Aspergillus terreus NIH2624]EAU32537.1 hypothetical protein ATEG_07153 [Aspergillus terreus NIH2624]